MFDPIDRVKLLLRNAAYVQPNAALNCTPATIVNINDPSRTGKCQVELYNFKAADNSISYASDWSAVLGLTINDGLLPKSLIGRQVLAFSVNNSYEQLLISLQTPLVYSADEALPTPSFENLGLEVITSGGTEAFKTICILRNGVYAWEKLSPLFHGHADGDTQQQFRDSRGDLEMPIDQLAISDKVFATTVSTYSKNSGNLPPILT